MHLNQYTYMQIYTYSDLSMYVGVCIYVWNVKKYRRTILAFRFLLLKEFETLLLRRFPHHFSTAVPRKSPKDKDWFFNFQANEK